MKKHFFNRPLPSHPRFVCLVTPAAWFAQVFICNPSKLTVDAAGLYLVHGHDDDGEDGGEAPGKHVEVGRHWLNQVFHL